MVMVTVNDIKSLRNELALILKNQPYTRKQRADQLLGKIVFQFLKMNQDLDKLKCDLGGITSDEGFTAVQILLTLGFTPAAIDKLLGNPDFTRFCIENLLEIKTNMTPATLMKTLNLFLAYQFEFNKPPESFKALKEYALIIQNRDYIKT
jgi:hypothetical protein